MFKHAQTGCSAREAYYEVQHCPSAQGIDAGTLRTACEVEYDPNSGCKRKTVQEATDQGLLRPKKVKNILYSVL